MKTIGTLSKFYFKKIRTIRNFIFLVCFLNTSSTIFSQTYSWYQLPNSPYHFGRFENISFINANTGWLIHAYGTVYRTTDGGNSWILQDSIPLGSFRSVQFINESTGWIGSLNSNFVLFKTTNGGLIGIQLQIFPTQSHEAFVDFMLSMNNLFTGAEDIITLQIL